MNNSKTKNHDSELIFAIEVETVNSGTYNINPKGDTLPLHDDKANSSELARNKSLQDLKPSSEPINSMVMDNLVEDASWVTKIALSEALYLFRACKDAEGHVSNSDMKDEHDTDPVLDSVGLE